MCRNGLPPTRPRWPGSRVALTGATGGLGRELCFYLAGLGAELILLDRSREKAQALDAALRAAFPAVSIRRIFVELTDMDSVRAACTALAPLHPQVLILNAGAYAIPRHRSTAGYDDVFQIDFVSPYYMVRALLPAHAGWWPGGGGGQHRPPLFRQRSGGCGFFHPPGVQ